MQMFKENIIIPVSLFLAISGAIFTFSKVNTLTDIMTVEVAKLRTQIQEIQEQQATDIAEIKSDNYNQRERLGDQIDVLRDKTNINAIHLGRIETKLDLIYESIKRKQINE